MAAKTIAERLCQTKCMAARHILQDEAAMVGAQGVVSEDLEARLTQAEAKDLLSKEYTPMTYHGVQDVSSEHVEAKARCPKTADPLNKEYRPIRCAESEFPQVQWLRGRAIVCPGGKNEEDLVVEQFEFPRSDPLNKEYRPIRCAESEFPQVQWLRGRAIVCPGGKNEEDLVVEQFEFP